MKNQESGPKKAGSGLANIYLYSFVLNPPPLIRKFQADSGINLFCILIPEQIKNENIFL